ncbi:MAG: asparagine synthase (glutamine-hydrolyzing) [Chloroflexota bacterium]
MCGIVGVLSREPIDVGLVEHMRDRMLHRGPDHGGSWRSSDGHVCFGHRRLAIVDLTPEANQPFVSQDGRFVVTYNGEIYNFKVLRHELQASGVHFTTQSDTEVLVEAYRRWGSACVERLSGMFAFALWDQLEHRLFCARDRAGEKPFYYSLAHGSFIFASELKGLVDWPGFRRVPNYAALIDYLSLGFVADPKSIWEGASKLPPAHSMYVTFDDSGLPVVHPPVAYWDLEFDPDYTISDWGSPIRETLQAASREMAFADVPVGAFLSGGVDSSSVVAALSQGGHDVRSFTIGFDESGYDERGWARAVARQYGVSHTERVVVADDIDPVFNRLVWHYDEPFNDYSYLPTYYLCREARRNVTVALSGDGGDEVFAGYRKYQRLALRAHVRGLVPSPLSSLMAATAQALLPAASQLRRTVRQYGLSEPEAFADMLTTGLSIPMLRSAARGPLAEALRHYTPLDAVEPLVRHASPSRVGAINTMRYLDLKLTLAGDILTKVDRASMAVSLEVRAVFLHRDLMDLARRIPPELLADRWQAKRALKSALEPWLPNSVLYRRKMGFAMPLKAWIDGRPDALPEDGGRAALRELLDEGLMDRMLRGHAAGKADLSAAIHGQLFLQSWLHTWMDSAKPAA